ncbi:GNAT family N-acetyltransferase [Chryseobacterium shigense]|uniref:Ribosomal protein S18 acetylase RimI n=1 Tax=Chryseobacterium shigense TaxID=297244 RepID=A0A1N7HUK3_9FLAO|nr:N-acetyltransferase [Chryseobacterium shigense]PQA93195.1 GNAT family N-acetyltransferase [Chryseobacterium shigense]SIS28529.1 Ribosomal protein S18 acetylase RimI [Chryseobacterium shigense]
MENININKVTSEDLDQLQIIGRKTFGETFSESNTAENMAKYLEEGFSKEKLIAELNDSDSVFYFAVCENNTIGYLKMNFGKSQTELKDGKGAEIERIYVLKEFHGRKAGQKLYEKALEIAAESNSDYVWLGVWEKNPRAISFYKKNGFAEFDRHVFVLGDDAQTDIMMKKLL